MRSQRDARELIRLQIEELWGRGRVDLVDEIYHDDVVDHMPLPGQPSGKEALKAVVAQFHEAIDNLTMEVHGIVGDGEYASDFWTLKGTYRGGLMDVPGAGQPLAFSGIDWVRAKDGVITDIWHAEELHRMEDQIKAVAGRLGARR
ncbi:MAG: ester cyclase [Parvularcula sp.]|jgi:steroid delta-isomerase-like uncharacterized protein|nr:ester cyclase [Parvularcula sp.]